jgi:aromatic-L-amino-acid decarboxylase
MRAPLPTHLPEQGLPATEVVRAIAAAAEPGLTGNAGGRFFAWVKGGALPAALATDIMCSAWDQNAVLASTSPAGAVLEEVAGRFLLEALRLPSDCSYAFVTGCQMAHLTALAAARHAVLARHGWDVEAKGLQGAPVVRVLANAHHHSSVTRALRLLGLGSDCVVPLGGDRPGYVSPDVLREALALAPHAPTIVILNAGDLNIGACDDFMTLCPIAQAAGAWVHVDGAFGLWANASPRLAPLVAGVERADSWATDGHKWLNTPYDCGMALTRDPVAHSAAMRMTAAYLTTGGVDGAWARWSRGDDRAMLRSCRRHLRRHGGIAGGDRPRAADDEPGADPVQCARWPQHQRRGDRRDQRQRRSLHEWRYVGRSAGDAHQRVWLEYQP